MTTTAKPPLRLTDIMWEQVLCKYLLPYLSLEELFRLRGVSSDFRNLVDFYFSHTFTVHVTEPCSTRFSCEAFEVLTKQNYFLKELILCNAGKWLTDEALTTVLQNNPDLYTVDLSQCHYITDIVVSAIGEHCRKVCKLSLQQCPKVSGRGLQSLINNASLQYIDLSGCSGLAEDDIIKLATHCMQIKYFLLNEMYHITNRTVEVIARCCPDLLQLSVQMSWRLTDRCIHTLAEFCPKLETLQMLYCKQITEHSLSKLRERNVQIDRPFQDICCHFTGVYLQT